jgi:hypothetical protein
MEEDGGFHNAVMLLWQVFLYLRYEQSSSFHCSGAHRSFISLANFPGAVPGSLDAEVACHPWRTSHNLDFDFDPLLSRQVVFGSHCYGCTAGAESSCGGAVVKAPEVSA